MQIGSISRLDRGLQPWRNSSELMIFYGLPCFRWISGTTGWISGTTGSISGTIGWISGTIGWISGTTGWIGGNLRRAKYTREIYMRTES